MRIMVLVSRRYFWIIFRLRVVNNDYIEGIGYVQSLGVFFL